MGGEPSGNWTRRRFLATGAWLGTAALGVGTPGGRARAAAQLPPDADAPALSLFAVGDTGSKIHAWGSLAAIVRVAGAMREQSRTRPVDGVVLLGDQFYPNGLSSENLHTRLRENLVEPFGSMIGLTPYGAEQLGVAAEREGPGPVPFYAVLGNHDYGFPESPPLQREVLPTYLTSWRMPHRFAEAWELPGGVSLVLFDSVRWDDGVPQELLLTLRRTRGPFRILAAHYPMADPGNNHLPTFTRDMHSVLREAGVPVHVFLSGHEHNLQLLQMEQPAPPLHVISGGGSNVREVSPTAASRAFALASLGFARIDRVEHAGAPALRVGVYAVPRWPWQESPHGRLVARAWVDADGATSFENA
jgi:hypothetical protein